MRRSVLAALLLGAALLAPSAAAGTARTVTISNELANESVFMKAFDTPATGIGDFDGDGQPELVQQNDNQRVYVMSTTQPRILAEFRPDYPSGWGVRPINDPAVADIDNDGRLDIVVVNSAAVVCDYEYVSGTSTTSMTFAKNWCKRMDGYMSGAAADAGAYLSDVNGDGKMEIFSNTENKGLYAFNHDGSVRWSKDQYGGNAGPLVADVDKDGRKEAIFFGDGGEVRAYDASSGSSKWSFFASSHVWPASIPVAGSAGDVDGDGKDEIVFVARDAEDATNHDNNHFMLFVLSHTGSLQWKAQPSWGNPMSYTHPALVDVNGDGRKDIVSLDWNTMGHKPGNWESLGPANVFAYDGFGSLLWRTELSNTWSNDDLGIADVDGDGALEVLSMGWGSSGDGMWYLDARTGAKESYIPFGSGWTGLRGPVLGDLDGSGKLSWAISVHSSSRGGAYQVYKTDADCNAKYAGWQNRYACGEGAIGGGGDGGGGVDPTGNLTATFSPRSASEWWIQVKVSADQPLSGVDVSINDGSWKPLTLRNWGDWAASYHAPEGSILKFRATSTSGAQAVSGCYRWISMTPVTCGGGSGGDGGGTGAFAATWKNVRGNEWWVETDVSVSGGTLAGVDARVNGGAWVALTKQSYGSWAKSVHAAPGSTVEFRARATDGQTSQSGSYTWPPG